MAEPPYNPNLITPSVYGSRRPVTGALVALLHIIFEERGLAFIQSRSRALLRGEIHELMVTDEEDAAPGGGADSVSAIAFFEVEQGGLAVVGDKVSLGGEVLGTLVGFDVTHMPNHINVVVKRKSLDILPLSVGDRLEIRRKI
jgi:hypothetical protein